MTSCLPYPYRCSRLGCDHLLLPPCIRCHLLLWKSKGESVAHAVSVFFHSEFLSFLEVIFHFINFWIFEAFSAAEGQALVEASGGRKCLLGVVQAVSWVSWLLQATGQDRYLALAKRRVSR